jgi:hypothetical protein
MQYAAIRYIGSNHVASAGLVSIFFSKSHFVIQFGRPDTKEVEFTNVMDTKRR